MAIAYIRLAPGDFVKVHAGFTLNGKAGLDSTGSGSTGRGAGGLVVGGCNPSLP